MHKDDVGHFANSFNTMYCTHIVYTHISCVSCNLEKKIMKYAFEILFT